MTTKQVLSSKVGKQIRNGRVQDVEVVYYTDGSSTVKPLGPYRAITSADRAGWRAALDKIVASGRAL